MVMPQLFWSLGALIMAKPRLALDRPQVFGMADRPTSNIVSGGPRGIASARI